jgi:muramoyltetrapeptide carboxypeptidase
MRTIKPRRIKHGDVIGVCAPASPPASTEKLNKGITYLERCGFRVELGKNVFKKDGYLAGSDVQRAADLNIFFANPKVKAIFTVRGGYGSHRILPLLDYNLIKRNPKILVGYSDITALHLALLAKTNLITFAGPMVAVEMSDGLTGEAEEQFWNCLTSPKPTVPIKGTNHNLSATKKNGITAGHLLGGNLSLVAALVGTPYFPSVNNQILILEEIDEKPYRIDRILTQMKLANVFKNTKGIVLGDFHNCEPKKGKPSLTLNQVFKDVFQGYQIPIIFGFPFGHLKDSLSFPIGVRVRLIGKKNKLEFLEAGVV